MAMDGFSRLILEAKGKGLIRDVRVAGETSLTHICFVDDILIFGNDTYLEWNCHYDIIRVFCNASDMIISPTKPSFLSLTGRVNHRILALFPYCTSSLDGGFKYLGFTLKPSCYGKGDWIWLLDRIERRIWRWGNKWLSLGGRLALAKSVLEGLPVYWMALFKLLKYILNGIRRRIFSFLWSRKKEDDKIHLVGWESLSIPKAKGGCRLLNLESFSSAC